MVTRATLKQKINLLTNAISYNTKTWYQKCCNVLQLNPRFWKGHINFKRNNLIIDFFSLALRIFTSRIHTSRFLMLSYLASVFKKICYSYSFLYSHSFPIYPSRGVRWCSFGEKIAAPKIFVNFPVKHP